MTHKYLIAGAIVLATLAGCSSMEEREIASGSFEYLEQKPGQKVKLPDDVDSPKFNNAYKLPELGKQAPRDLVGKKLKVLSPALVLPLVIGSHVEEGSKSALIWFDQLDDSVSLDERIWSALRDFMDTQSVEVESFDQEQQRLVTGFMVLEKQEEKSWYSWSEAPPGMGHRFEFVLDLKPHGRTAALKVKLLESKSMAKQGKELTAKQIVEARRAEVEALNKVVSHYDFQLRLANAQRINQIRQGLVMELGLDETGKPSYVVDASYNVAWPRLLLVLRKLGFDVKDYDKTNGLLFVTYNGPDVGWWSSMWGSNDDSLDLDKDDYRFRVSPWGEKTSITIMDEESTPLSEDILNSIFSTFSRTMASDNLDM